MSLAGLQFNLLNIKTRRSQVFIHDTGGTGGNTTAKRNVGQVRDVSYKLTPINAPKSTRGAMTQTGVALEATFTMAQTSDAELVAIEKITREGPFGTTLRFTNKATDDGTAPATVFENASVSFEGTIDGSGGDSMLVFKINGEFDLADLTTFLTGLGAADANKGYVVGDKVFKL